MTGKALHHWFHELTSRASATEAERALATLTVTASENVAVIGRAAASPLFEARTDAAARTTAETVRIEPDVYDTIPTTDARVRLLTKAAAIAPSVRVHAPLAGDGAHRGRLGIDLPRRLVRVVGIGAAEPGDRFTGRYRHVFFDDEPLVAEGRAAGLTFAARDHAWAVFVRETHVDVAENADSFAAECVRVSRCIASAERLRLEASPDRAVEAMRSRGRTAKTRGVVGRARLRRAIGWVDAALPGTPNCFRRVLVEIGLDGGAATETLVFGLDVGKTGHVAFKGAEERAFDVAFEIRG